MDFSLQSKPPQSQITQASKGIFSPKERFVRDVTSRVILRPFKMEMGRGYCLQISGNPNEFYTGDLILYERRKYRIMSTETFWEGKTPDTASDKINLIVHEYKDV